MALNMKELLKEVDSSEEEYLYRYEEIRYSLGIDQYDEPLPGYNLKIELSRFRILKRTPKGVWISLYGRIWDDKRFVLLTANKKYACITKADAMVSFIARKKKQIQILRGQLKQANEALDLAEGKPKSRFFSSF